MPELAPHIPAVPESGIRRIFQLAADQPGGIESVISLGVGEPDRGVPAHVRDAAVAAWQRGATRYTPNGGILPLRRAVAEKLAARNGLEVDLEQVWITIGGTQALQLALELVLSPGDEVLVPDPGYTTFTMSTRLLGGVAVPYPLTVEHDFRPRVEDLDALVTPRTKVLIINSPSNPLGAVFEPDVLRELLAFARRHDLWVLSDEVYEAFVWSGEHTSIAALQEPGEQRVMTVHSFSKTYAMTGVRVGSLVVPPGLSRTMRTLQECTVGCVAEPDEYAALAALTGPQDDVLAARAHYQGNLAAAASALDAAGLRYLEPGGSFYLWAEVAPRSEGDVSRWAERLLMDRQVFVAPGSAFGRRGEGWIRICAAADRASLLEGIDRLVTFDA